jgi:hexokinase
MAVDLGGTNFRVCSIQLHGNSTFSLTQSKVKIPPELMKAKTAKELFSFLAKQIQGFLEQHHNDHYQGHVRRRESTHSDTGYKEEEIFNLGFTFSFPVRQVGINKGYLMRWTKGFDITDAVGKDVCALLQDEIDALHLPVKVAALVNDTVGTLMARSYTSPASGGTLLGAIFGTGTNGAYVEKLDKITKMTEKKENAGSYDTSTGEMIVNTEWGSFDNALKTLPTSAYDIALDKTTPNPGIQMFEKRISGMYLGEIFRIAVLSMIEDAAVPLFSDEHSATNDLHTTTCINSDSPLYTEWGVDSSFLSQAAGDSSDGLRITRQAIQKDLGVDAPSTEDAEAIKMIAQAVGKRAARLAAVAVGAIVIKTGRLELSNTDDDTIDVGVDGSLVEFYPGFEASIREA